MKYNHESQFRHVKIFHTLRVFVKQQNVNSFLINFMVIGFNVLKDKMRDFQDKRKCFARVIFTVS